MDYNFFSFFIFHLELLPVMQFNENQVGFNADKPAQIVQYKTARTNGAAKNSPPATRTPAGCMRVVMVTVNKKSRGHYGNSII